MFCFYCMWKKKQQKNQTSGSYERHYIFILYGRNVNIRYANNKVNILFFNLRAAPSSLFGSRFCFIWCQRSLKALQTNLYRADTVSSGITRLTDYHHKRSFRFVNNTKWKLEICYLFYKSFCFGIAFFLNGSVLFHLVPFFAIIVLGERSIAKENEVHNWNGRFWPESNTSHSFKCYFTYTTFYC